MAKSHKGPFESEDLTPTCGCRPGDYRDSCPVHGSGVNVVSLRRRVPKKVERLTMRFWALQWVSAMRSAEEAELSMQEAAEIMRECLARAVMHREASR
jgi:hypothetical protein